MLILLSVFVGLSAAFLGIYFWTNHFRGKVIYVPEDRWSEEEVRRIIEEWSSRGWEWVRTNERARSIRFRRKGSADRK
ncbi:MAG: hypothetical protein QJR06_08675 [Alicyclobacillaceae bacterium]|nr:hypothetical protein [Alicyclobacillaceae bacterium]